jgi:uncharacterized protein
MKVELEKTFPLPATAAAAWALLQDIQAVAGCMPGAKITERVDPTHYKGTISVRVGPASMAFKGELEVLELDAAQRTLHLVGKGSDTTGSSGASMDLLARIEPAATGNACSLVGRSEVTMSGKAAAFGGRMMGSVADQILKQFAGNFATQVKSRAEAASAQTDGVSTVATDQVAGAARNTSEPSAEAPSRRPVADATRPDSTPAAPPNELNALALFWAILRDWFRGLFRRKAA